MLQPLNVATPALTDFGFATHVNVAPAVPVPATIASEICDVLSVVTVFPSASLMVTIGCGANAAPPVVLAGLPLKTSCVAAPGSTVIVGLPAVRFTGAPVAPARDAAWNVAVPGTAGAVTLVPPPAYVIEKILFGLQLMSTAMVHGPEPPIEARVAEPHWPLFTETNPALALALDCGGVQPVGTARVTREPGPKDPLAWNVNVKLLPVEPAVALDGLTIIVPSPLVVACACVTANSTTAMADSMTIASVIVRDLKMRVVNRFIPADLF
jgi:hypothetical protein